MNIGLVLDPYGEKNPGGLGRAIFEMTKALLETDRSNGYTVYVKNQPVIPPAFFGNNWHLKALGSTSLFLQGARTIDRHLDLYVFLNPIIPLFFFPKKSIIVVHDFAYLEIPDRSLKQKVSALFLYGAHALSLWKATKVVAVSEAAKQSAIRHFAISPQKITVIYNGFVAFDGAPQPVETPEHFFLFAGVLKERKNVLGIIRAFGLFAASHEDFSLLIAGKTQGAYYEQCQALVKELGIGEQVRFLGYVTDAELACLYAKAVALVFPSIIEGFGMPVLEAMHVGLPVITSNYGALAEVAGNAALLVDPGSPEEIASAMSHIAGDTKLREELKEKGLARSAQFSWQKTAKEILEVISN